VLPMGFMKIRHFGILSSRNKAGCIESVREQFDVAPVDKPVKGMNWMETFEMLYGRHPKQCPCCGKGILLVVATIEPGYRIRQRDGPKLRANPGFGKRQA